MISIVIPAFNAQKTIGACLEALAHQTVPKEVYEIIVVDDGSTDRTAAIVRQYAVKLLRQSNQGPAAARNYGVQEAKGDLIFFIDADCVATANWIEEMSRPFQHAEVVGIKGVYRTRQRELAARFVQIEYEHKYERMGKRLYIDFIDTYSAGFRRDVFLRYDGFDTSFPTASVEDQEFSFRLAKDGHKMVFQPRAVVYHTHQPTFKGYLRRKFFVAYWKVRVLIRHPRRLGTDSHTPQSLKSQLFWMYLFGGCLLAAMIFPRLLLGAGISFVLFLLSTLPFVAFAFQRDKAVALVTPAIFFLRALVFCSGLLTGTISLIWNKRCV